MNNGSNFPLQCEKRRNFGEKLIDGYGTMLWWIFPFGDERENQMGLSFSFLFFFIYLFIYLSIFYEEGVLWLADSFCSL